jgi:hypothetical protein
LNSELGMRKSQTCFGIRSGVIMPAIPPPAVFHRAKMEHVELNKQQMPHSTK